MNNEGQQKYFEQVDKFIEFAKKNTGELEKLSESIGGLSDKLSNLTKIEELNFALTNLDGNIKKIQMCNTNLQSIFSNIDSLDATNQNIDETKALYKEYLKKLEEINEYLNVVESQIKNLSLEDTKVQIDSIITSISNLKKTIETEIREKIDNNIKENLEQLTSGVLETKNLIEDYKKKTEEQIKLLTEENREIKEEFKRILESNDAIIALFNEMKNKNSNIEEFMNNLVEKWYDKNVSFFGKRRNKKGD